jgi:hypothetical protein
MEIKIPPNHKKRTNSGEMKLKTSWQRYKKIVRGKERKTVVFGAKCNNIMIDGITFIEKLSFNAFYEGARLKHCVSLAKKLSGEEVKKIGVDPGYHRCALYCPPGRENAGELHA